MSRKKKKHLTLLFVNSYISAVQSKLNLSESDEWFPQHGRARSRRALTVKKHKSRARLTCLNPRRSGAAAFVGELRCLGALEAATRLADHEVVEVPLGIGTMFSLTQSIL